MFLSQPVLLHAHRLLLARLCRADLAGTVYVPKCGHRQHPGDNSACQEGSQALQRPIEGVGQMPLPQLDRAVVTGEPRVAGALTLEASATTRAVAWAGRDAVEIPLAPEPLEARMALAHVGRMVGRARAHADAMPRAIKATLGPTRAPLLALRTIVAWKAPALTGEAFAVTTGCARQSAVHMSVVCAVISTPARVADASSGAAALTSAGGKGAVVWASTQELGPLASSAGVAAVAHTTSAHITPAVGAALAERLRGAAAGSDISRCQQLFDGHAERNPP